MDQCHGEGPVTQIPTLRRATAAVTAAFAVTLAGCDTTSETKDPVAQESAGASSTPAGAAPAGPPRAACPLVDTSLLPTLFRGECAAAEGERPVAERRERHRLRV